MIPNNIYLILNLEVGPHIWFFLRAYLYIRKTSLEILASLIYSYIKKMKHAAYPIVAFLVLLAVLSFGLYYVVSVKTTEAYESLDATQISDLEKAYNALRIKLKMVLEPYCTMSTFIQAQMKTTYMADKVSESGDPIRGDTDSEADKHIMQTFKEVYNCTDDLADSRPICKSFIAARNLKLRAPGPAYDSMEFIPCTAYTDLPQYDETNQDSMGEALGKIPNNLAERITKETAWYAVVMKKLQDGLDEGNNPPTNEKQCGRKKKEGFADAPKIAPEDRMYMIQFPSTVVKPSDDLFGQDIKNSDAANVTGGAGVAGSAASVASLGSGVSTAATAGSSKGAAAKVPSIAGSSFGGPAKAAPAPTATCSPAAAQARRELLRKRKLAAAEAEAASCTLPDLMSEIARINRLLDSKDLKDTLKQCRDLTAKAKALRLNLDKLKNGDYYEWQKTGPKKSYKKYDLSDRTASFNASLLQNR